MVDAEVARWLGYWRVDEIGHIVDNTVLGSKLVIYFSEIKPESINKPLKYRSRTGKTRTIARSAGHLLIFTVGSVWHKGYIVFTPSEPESYWIEPSSGFFTRRDEEIEVFDRRFDSIINTIYFGFEKNSSRQSNAQYKVIPIENEQTSVVIVPAAEIFRYYFGASDRLLSAILRGRIENYINWKMCSIENGKVSLLLRYPLKREEMIPFARLLAADSKNSLYQPHKHLATLKANQSLDGGSPPPCLNIMTDFPFKTSAHLHVVGKAFPLIELSSSTSEKQHSVEPPKVWAFFVMRIVGCTRDVGFSSIDYAFETGAINKNAKGQMPSNGIPQHIAQIDELDDHELLDDLADARIKRLSLSVNTECLSNIDKVDFKCLGAIKTEDVSGHSRLVDIEATRFTTNDGNYSGQSQGVVGVNVTTDYVHSVCEGLKHFISIVKQMRFMQETRWRVETRATNNPLFDRGERVSVFTKGLGKRLTWHSIEYDKGSSRLRQFVWVEIENIRTNRFAYIFEMEVESGENGQSTLLLHRNDYQVIGPEFVLKLSRLTAHQNRWPHVDHVWRYRTLEKEASELFGQAKLIRVKHSHIKDGDNPVARRAATLINRLSALL